MGAGSRQESGTLEAVCRGDAIVPVRSRILGWWVAVGWCLRTARRGLGARSPGRCVRVVEGPCARGI